MRKGTCKIGDLVKVLVNEKYRFTGEIVELENDIATVKVKAHYGNMDLLIQQPVKDLWRVVKDLKDFEKHGYY